MNETAVKIMVRSTLIACSAVFSLPALAQSDSPTDRAVTTPTPVSLQKPALEKGPVGAVTFGYIYIDSEVMPGEAWNSHLHGFFGIPQYNVKPWLAGFADFTQTYNTARNTHENVQSRLGGLLFHRTQQAEDLAVRVRGRGGCTGFKGRHSHDLADPCIGRWIYIQAE